MAWRPSPVDMFPEKPIVMPNQEEQQQIEGVIFFTLVIGHCLNQDVSAAKPAIYRPPGARGKPPPTVKLVYGF